MHAYQRLLTIDPSLTCSGWALFRIESERLAGAGKIKSFSAEVSMSGRLADLQQKVTKVYQEMNLCQSDVVICEAPTTMKDPRAAMQVEQVRGIFETLARQFGAVVPGRVNPRSVQYEVIGLKGKQLAREVVKSSAVRTVQALYSDELRSLGLECDLVGISKHQDIVDAILVGTYALSRLSQATVSGLPIEEVFEERSRRIFRKRRLG